MQPIAHTFEVHLDGEPAFTFEAAAVEEQHPWLVFNDATGNMVGMVPIGRVVSVRRFGAVAILAPAEEVAA